MSRETEGIEVRHRKSCKTDEERGCTCKPGYRATVEMPRGRTGKRRLDVLLAELVNAGDGWASAGGCVWSLAVVEPEERLQGAVALG